ncbi:MAG: VWA domain-containing protein [Bacteroidales bacterium]|nr:VWA domain-containing protein [Candidatus Sodaliphilus fimicaballi]
MEKAKIYNVIILDKSGSMSSIRKEAVDSVNETLGAIRSVAKKNPECKQYVSVVAFCGCELKNFYTNTIIDEVKNIDANDYTPCCTTPLYDAVGCTITKLHSVMNQEENVTASVTIITDGYENASKEFSGRAVKALIEAYKNEGWMFAYIGADHDVEAVAFSLSIDNTLQFEKTAAGINAMASEFRNAYSSWSEEVGESLCDDTMSKSNKFSLLRAKGRGFFKK